MFIKKKKNNSGRRRPELQNYNRSTGHLTSKRTFGRVLPKNSNFKPAISNCFYSSNCTTTHFPIFPSLIIKKGNLDSTQNFGTKRLGPINPVFTVKKKKIKFLCLFLFPVPNSPSFESSTIYEFIYLFVCECGQTEPEISRENPQFIFYTASSTAIRRVEKKIVESL